jgi:hypothetical protein
MIKKNEPKEKKGFSLRGLFTKDPSTKDLKKTETSNLNQGDLRLLSGHTENFMIIDQSKIKRMISMSEKAQLD